MSLDLAFIDGQTRAAFPSFDEAVDAAREAYRLDEQHRARAVWFARGRSAAGVVVPDRYVVGLARKRPPAELGTPMEIVGGSRRG